MIVGHAAVLSRLKAALPPVALFEGPQSVGKWATAEYLRTFYGVANEDTFRARRLDVETAKTIVDFTSTAPIKELKLVIISMAGATKAAQHILLKTLEESHERVCFILVASYPVLDTISSRAVRYQFGALSDTEVAQVLELRKMKPGDAKALADRARGSVKQAFEATEVGEYKPLVVLALRAISLKDSDALEQLAGRWTDEHTEYLRKWAREALTAHWRWFSPEDSEITGNRIPLKLLMALRPDIRPKLVVRASLMSVLKGA